MNNVRQVELAINVYVSGNSGSKLPLIEDGPAWAWDLPDSAAQGMLANGMGKKIVLLPRNSLERIY
jgi:hypothetical protein